MNRHLLLGLAIPFACFLAIIYVPWEPTAQFGFQRDMSPKDHEGPISAEDFTRTTVYFDSHGDKLEAWLYLPKGAASAPKGAADFAPDESIERSSENTGESGTHGVEESNSNRHTEVLGEEAGNGNRRPPVAVMTNGISLQKDQMMHDLAVKLSKMGLAVFLFDLRGFGGSDGEPRHWASPPRHLEDWWAAVAFVKGGGLGDAVDSERVVLSGFSFGGAHALVTASKLGTNISAVVTWAPYLDVDAGKDVQARTPTIWLVRVLLAAVSDTLRWKLNMQRLYLPMFTRDEDFGLMQISRGGDYELFFGSLPKNMQGGWRNVAAPSTAFEIYAYNPISYVPKVACPVMLVGGSNDYQSPAKYYKKAASLLPPESVEYLELNATHFGVLTDPALPTAVMSFVRRRVA